MKKPEQKPKPKKRTVAVKDLTAKDAAKVKGGTLAGGKFQYQK